MKRTIYTTFAVTFLLLVYLTSTLTVHAQGIGGNETCWMRVVEYHCDGTFSTGWVHLDSFKDSYGLESGSDCPTFDFWNPTPTWVWYKVRNYCAGGTPVWIRPDPDWIPGQFGSTGHWQNVIVCGPVNSFPGGSTVCDLYEPVPWDEECTEEDPCIN